MMDELQRTRDGTWEEIVNPRTKRRFSCRALPGGGMEIMITLADPSSDADGYLFASFTLAQEDVMMMQHLSDNAPASR